MRGKTGTETLCEMRAVYPHLDVLILADYHDAQLATGALSCPPLVLLPKQADTEPLLRTVLQMLEGAEGN